MEQRGWSSNAVPAGALMGNVTASLPTDAPRDTVASRLEQALATLGACEGLVVAIGEKIMGPVAAQPSATGGTKPQGLAAMVMEAGASAMRLREVLEHINGTLA